MARLCGPIRDSPHPGPEPRWRSAGAYPLATAHPEHMPTAARFHIGAIPIRLHRRIRAIRLYDGRAFRNRRAALTLPCWALFR